MCKSRMIFKSEIAEITSMNQIVYDDFTFLSKLNIRANYYIIVLFYFSSIMFHFIVRFSRFSVLTRISLKLFMLTSILFVFFILQGLQNSSKIYFNDSDLNLGAQSDELGFEVSDFNAYLDNNLCCCLI